jgi:hypothetical protein
LLLEDTVSSVANEVGAKYAPTPPPPSPPPPSPPPQMDNLPDGTPWYLANPQMYPANNLLPNAWPSGGGQLLYNPPADSGDYAGNPAIHMVGLPPTLGQASPPPSPFQQQEMQYNPPPSAQDLIGAYNAYHPYAPYGTPDLSQMQQQASQYPDLSQIQNAARQGTILPGWRQGPVAGAGAEMWPGGTVPAASGPIPSTYHNPFGTPPADPSQQSFLGAAASVANMPFQATGDIIKTVTSPLTTRIDQALPQPLQGPAEMAGNMAAGAPAMLIPGVGPLAYAGMGLQGADVFQQVAQGKMSVGQAVKVLGPQVGMILMGEGLRLGIPAVRDFVTSPEGRAVAAKLQTEGGGGAPLNPGGEPVKPGSQPPVGPEASGGMPAPDALSAPPESMSLTPATTSEGIASIATKVRDMIATARRLGPEQAQMISEQKAARVQGAAARLEQGGGFPAFHESKSFLAGEYGKPTFEPPAIPPEDVNALVDHISTAPDAQYFDKLGALTAVEKWTMGIKPADAELTKLESFLPAGTNLKQAFEQQAMRGTPQGAGPIAEQMRGLPSRGGTQLELGADSSVAQADTQAALENIRQRIADGKAITADQMARLEAEAARLREMPSRGGTQMALGEPTPGELNSQTQEALSNIRERVAAGQKLSADQQARLGELADASRQLPESGMQTRLADAVNEAYVGAVAAGRGVTDTTGTWIKRLQTILSPVMLIKTFKTSFDIGWGGRQGWRLLPSNFGSWWKMYGRQFQTFASEGKFQEMDAATKAFPNFTRSQSMERPLAYLQRGTGSPLTSGEEFMSPLSKHIPGLNQSERAYVGPGNLMRQEILDSQVRKIVGLTGAPVSDVDFQLLIDNLNNATLRGSTKFLGNEAAQTIGSLAFSLKGAVSGPQFLADALRASVNSGDIYSTAAQRIIQKQVAAYVGMGMGTMGVFAAMGWTLNKAGVPSPISVDFNWHSKTFGQINVGGYRWNYWGSDQPLVRYIIGASTGQEQKASGLPTQGADRLRLTKNFIGGKVAPGLPRLGVDIAAGGYDPNLGSGNPVADYVGVGRQGGMINSPAGALVFAIDQVNPLFFTNTFEAWKNMGIAGVAATYPAEVSGFSTSQYDTSATPKQQQSAAREEAVSKVNPTGIFNAPANAWQVVAGSKPKFGSMTEYRKALHDQMAATGMGEDQITKRIDALPVVQRYAAELKAARDRTYAAYPWLKPYMAHMGISP